MARAERLAGARLAETHGAYHPVGNAKVPCDWTAAGFEPPGEIDVLDHPVIPLPSRRPPEIESPGLIRDVEGDALPGLLADLFVTQRTGFVSERLRSPVTPVSQEDDRSPAEAMQARWLGEIPSPIWRIVRGVVLRCT